MKRHARILTGLLAALTSCALLAGCGASSASSTAIAEIDRGAAADYESAAGASSWGGAEEGMTDEGTLLAPDPARKIIYTADLSLESTEFDSASASLLDALAQAGGYVQSSESGGSTEYGRWVRWSLRVPADQYRSFLTAAENSASRTSLSESTEDVTADYVDVEARLNSLEAQRQRLEELRAQAGNLEDLLAIENQLTQVQYQIESYTGQKRVLDDQITYSTVNVYLDEVKVLSPTSTSFGSRIARAFTEGWRGFGHGLQDLAVALVGGLPWLLVLALAAAGGTALYRRRPRRQKRPSGYAAPQPAPQKEQPPETPLKYPHFLSSCKRKGRPQRMGTPLFSILPRRHVAARRCDAESEVRFPGRAPEALLNSSAPCTPGSGRAHSRSPAPRGG